MAVIVGFVSLLPKGRRVIQSRVLSARKQARVQVAEKPGVAEAQCLH